MINSKTTDGPLSGISVLVLDDEETIRELFHTVLVDKGCDVRTVSNGREGLQALLERDFDVAIVDVIMSEMDGLAFLEEAGKICPWLGVILASGYLDQPTTERAQALGVDQIFAKPVRIDALQKAVLHVAQSKNARVGAAGPDLVERMQYQLNILRRISESAIDSENLIDALRSLTAGINRAMPCDVVGMLGVEKENAAVVLRLQHALPRDLLDTIIDRMIEQFQGLSGQKLPRRNIEVEIKGDVGKDGTITLPSMHTVPVIAHAKVLGLLMFASHEENIFSDMDISFLYHAANHLSTVLASLGRMRQLAIRDPLTALYNRRYFEEEIRRFWLLFQRNKRPMSVLIIDVDHFKSINDTHGHPLGDRVLREFADILTGTARLSDVVGRSGGDEFVILMPEADSESAARVAERLVRETRKHIFCQNETPLRLTLSVGFATTHPDEPNISPEEILVRADQALYAAKNGGRNLICSWEGIRERQSDTASTWSFISPIPELPKQTDIKRSFDSVLIVDDDPQICDLLVAMLTRKGYTAEYCRGAMDAIKLLKKDAARFDIIISDLTLPGQDGFSLLEEVQTIDPTIVRIVITGYATADNAVESLRHGAYDFIAKPIVPDQLMAVLQRAMQYRKLMIENLSYQEYLEDMVRSKSAELRAAFDQTKNSYEFMLEAFVNMLDAREYETCQHSIRVRDHTLILASHMGIRGTQLEDFGRGALLHDIGKVGIPDTILLKIDKLSEAEWAIMRQHAEIGFNILKGSPFLRPAAELVLSHHERYDGTGYPNGARGDQLPVGARILGLIDAFDAMRYPRIYNKAMKEEDALQEVRNQSGRHFAPEVVEAFFDCYPQILEAERHRQTAPDDKS